jgi:hypothetical protein
MTQEAAYWIGFLMADGYILNKLGMYAVQICIQGRDSELNDKFRDFIGTNSKIRLDKLGRSNISVNSKQLVSKLGRFGLSGPKTGREVFRGIPRKLSRHFIRGYFDGDGCVSVLERKYNSLSVRFCCASRAFLSKIDEMISGDCGIKSGSVYSNPRGTCHYLTYTGRERIMRIYGYMYSDATTFLDRKKRVFDLAYMVWPRPSEFFVPGVCW